MVIGNIQKRTKEPEGRTEGPARQTASFHELLHCIFMGLSWRCHLIITRTLARHPELGMVRTILTVVEVKTHEPCARGTCPVRSRALLTSDPRDLLNGLPGP